jgi:hypothetical protein
MNKTIFHGVLYQSADDFFLLGGSGGMQLARSAGIEVMLSAINYGLIVMKYEAGIWHSPGFEARIDGIMWCPDPFAESYEAVEENNRLMAYDLRDDCPPECDAVIVSAFPYPYPRTGDSPRIKFKEPSRGDSDLVEAGHAVGLRRWKHIQD